MKYLFLTCLFTFFLFSCSSEDESLQSDVFSDSVDSQKEDSIRLESLAIDAISFPEKIYFNETYEVTFTYTLPNSCYSFYDIILLENENQLELAVAAEIEENKNCAEVLKKGQKTFNFKIDLKDQYIIKIFKGKTDTGDNVFEEIIIPVLEK